MKPTIQKPKPTTQYENGRCMMVTTKKKGFLFVNLISEADPAAEEKVAMLKHYQDQCADASPGSKSQRPPRTPPRGVLGEGTQVVERRVKKWGQCEAAGPAHCYKRGNSLRPGIPTREGFRSLRKEECVSDERHVDPAGRIDDDVVPDAKGTRTNRINLSSSSRNSSDINRNLREKVSDHTRSPQGSCQASAIECEEGSAAEQSSIEFPVILGKLEEHIGTGSSLPSDPSHNHKLSSIHSIYMSSRNTSRSGVRTSLRGQTSLGASFHNSENPRIHNITELNHSRAMDVHVDRYVRGSATGDLPETTSLQASPKRSDFTERDAPSGNSFVSHGSPSGDVTLDCWKHRRLLMGIGVGGSTPSYPPPPNNVHGEEDCDFFAKVMRGSCGSVGLGENAAGEGSLQREFPVNEVLTVSDSLHSVSDESKREYARMPLVHAAARKGKEGEVERYQCASESESDEAGDDNTDVYSSAYKQFSTSELNSQLWHVLRTACVPHEALMAELGHNFNGVGENVRECHAGDTAEEQSAKARSLPNASSTFTAPDAPRIGSSQQSEVTFPACSSFRESKSASSANLFLDSSRSHFTEGVRVGGVLVVPPHTEYQRGSGCYPPLHRGGADTKLAAYAVSTAPESSYNRGLDDSLAMPAERSVSKSSRRFCVDYSTQSNEVMQYSEKDISQCSAEKNGYRCDTGAKKDLRGQPRVGFVYDSVLDCYYNPSTGDFLVTE